jgi:hypothetical protein
MLKEIGAMGFILLVLIIILIPFLCTIVLGVTFANMLGLSGITWWAFMILFYLVIMGILGLING